MTQELLTRQTRRAREIATHEKQVKELVRLLDITTSGLKKAATLMEAVSPEASVNLKAVVKTVSEKLDAILNPPKLNS